MTAVEFSGEKIDSGLKTLIERAFSTVIQYEGLRTDSQVCVELVSPAEMRGLNLRMRGVDSETDVLSFPAVTIKPGRVFAPKTRDRDVVTGRVMLGDVALSSRAAMSQAAMYGHSYEREMVYLCAHAFLHLLGYDHETDGEKAVMREKEEAVMNALGLER